MDGAENMELESTTAAGKKTTLDQRRLDKSDGVFGRRKRRGRDWIWRPVDDEDSIPQANHSTAPSGATLPAEIRSDSAAYSTNSSDHDLQSST